MREDVLRIIEKMQQNEITEHAIYTAIASSCKDDHNKKILLQIAGEEKAHYEIWKSYTSKTLAPSKFRVFINVITAKIFGFTFALKHMENKEEAAQKEYAILQSEVKETTKIMDDEQTHEKALLELLDEERLQYVGSMVLGLNDALVELTGTLAGLTFALQNTKIIALSGLITGISATLSMASSEFLSARSSGRKDAFKSCTYTGIAYLFTVALLILPYLIFPEDMFVYALLTMLVIVITIIFCFTYYISVAKGLSFKQRFIEMAVISLSVALLSFVIGIVVKNALGIDL